MLITNLSGIALSAAQTDPRETRLVCHRIAAVLRKAGIKTLADLTLRVPRRRRWWVDIDDLGVAGARRIEAFFASHADLTDRARALLVTTVPSEVVPWEKPVVPHEVDGSVGLHRAPRASCAISEGEWRLVRTVAEGPKWSYGWQPGAAQRLRFLSDFSYRTGLRAGERVHATLGCIEVDSRGDQWLHVLGKGSKAGKVVLPGLGLREAPWTDTRLSVV